MTIYLNLDTNEYPRFVGDIELNPNANWVEVIETERPPATETTVWVDNGPILIDGQYTQTWTEIPRPPQIILEPW